MDARPRHALLTVVVVLCCSALAHSAATPVGPTYRTSSGKYCYMTGPNANSYFPDGNSTSALFRLTATTPDGLTAGVASPIHLEFSFFNTSDATWAPIPTSALRETHQRMIHVMAVNKKLNTFLHVHPTDFQAESTTGVHIIQPTFAEPGDWVLVVDFGIAPHDLDICLAMPQSGHTHGSGDGGTGHEGHRRLHGEQFHVPGAPDPVWPPHDDPVVEIHKLVHVSVAGTENPAVGTTGVDSRVWRVAAGVVPGANDAYTGSFQPKVSEESCCMDNSRGGGGMPDGKTADGLPCYVAAARMIAVEKTSSIAQTFTERILPSTTDGRLEVAEHSCTQIEIDVTSAADGSVVGLRQFLGGAAHVMVARKDFTWFQHLHGSFDLPSVNLGVWSQHVCSAGGGHHSMSMTMSGSTVSIMVPVAATGDYRMFVEMATQDDHLVVASFDIVVGNPATVAAMANGFVAPPTCPGAPALPAAIQDVQGVDYGQGDPAPGGRLQPPDVVAPLFRWTELEWDTSRTDRFWFVNATGEHELVYGALDLVPCLEHARNDDRVNCADPLLVLDMDIDRLARPRVCVAEELQRMGKIVDCHSLAAGVGASAFVALLGKQQRDIAAKQSSWQLDVRRQWSGAKVDLVSVLREAMGSCGLDGACDAGCVHGAVIEYARSLDSHSRGELPSVCDLVAETPNLWRSCVEAVSAAYALSAQPLDAARVCASVAAEWVATPHAVKRSFVDRTPDGIIHERYAVCINTLMPTRAFKAAAAWDAPAENKLSSPSAEVMMSISHFVMSVCSPYADLQQLYDACATALGKAYYSESRRTVTWAKRLCQIGTPTAAFTNLCMGGVDDGVADALESTVAPAATWAPTASCPYRVRLEFDRNTHTIAPTPQPTSGGWKELGETGAAVGVLLLVAVVVAACIAGRLKARQPPLPGAFHQDGRGHVELTAGTFRSHQWDDDDSDGAGAGGGGVLLAPSPTHGVGAFAIGADSDDGDDTSYDGKDSEGAEDAGRVHVATGDDDASDASPTPLPPVANEAPQPQPADSFDPFTTAEP